MFSCEFWEISKNKFFTQHLWATASVACSNFLLTIMGLYKRKFLQIAQQNLEAACSVLKEVFLETLQNSLENTFTGKQSIFLVKFQA